MKFKRLTRPEGKGSSMFESVLGDTLVPSPCIHVKDVKYGFIWNAHEFSESVPDIQGGYQ